MLSKREYGFIVTVLIAFIFLIMILLFITAAQYVKINSSDTTFREMEFIRYRYK